MSKITWKVFKQVVIYTDNKRMPLAIFAFDEDADEATIRHEAEEYLHGLGYGWKAMHVDETGSFSVDENGTII